MPAQSSRGRWLALVAASLVLAGAAAWWWLAPRGETGSVDAPPASAEFVGSQGCARCHEAQHKAWQASQHALAMQHATDRTVLGDFDGARFRYAGVESVFTKRHGKFFVHTDAADGRMTDYEVKYTFGVSPLQQYLIEFPDGRIQALSIAWDTRPKERGGQRWFHLYPDGNIDHRDELHWTRRAQNWNFMCSDCHSTNVRKAYDAAADRYNTTWSEISVGCEACHGPGSAHVAWAERPGRGKSKGLTMVLDERAGVSWKTDGAGGKPARSAEKFTEREIEVCAQCHARRAQIADGYHPGRAFLDHYRPALLSPGLYHADGQQRDEVYIWGSFLQSRMHRRGVTCSDCHEPHTQKLRVPGNGVCAQCHLASKYDAPGHHRHPAGSSGAQCVECHMPATTYMVVDPRRDHSFRVPRPDLSVALGTPNACTGCHKDKPATWADTAIQQWYGRRPEGFQRFARTLHDMDRGSASAGRALLALAGDVSQPDIARATALQALGNHLSDASIEALRGGVANADPLLRAAAATSAALLPVERRLPLLVRLLDDPVRSVRIEAVAALADVPQQSLNAAQSASFERAAGEFESVQRYNADRPEARTALGSFHARRARSIDAEREFSAAIAMERTHVPAYVNFADLRREQGRDADAESILRDGLRHSADSAALHHALGLTLVRLKRHAEATGELKRATQLAPDDLRFAYVYAAALHATGASRPALAEVDRALARRPGDRRLLEAGASIAAELGDPVAGARYRQALAATGRP